MILNKYSGELGTNEDGKWEAGIVIWALFDFSEREGCKIFATDIRIISAIKVLDKEV